METKKRNTYILLVILLIGIIIIGGLLYLYLGNKNSADVDNSLIMNSKNLAEVIDANAIIGSWNAVSEEVNGVKTDAVDSSINFNADGSYSSIINGLNEEGFYKVTNSDGISKIIFYYSEENLNIGNYQEAFGNVNGNELTLVYPAYPKVVVYNKI